MKSFEEFLICMSQYGIWDIISFLVLITSSIIAIRYLWFPICKVDNLNFYITHTRDVTEYPSKLNFEIRNFSNKNIILSNTYFKPNKLVAHQNARGDTLLKKYEIKFPPHFTHPDCLIIHGQVETTWFPIDPNLTDVQIQEFIKNKKAGKFVCKCTFLTKRPRTIKLIIKT